MNISPQGHHFGWKPDRPDQRDHLYQARSDPRSLPTAVDLRPQCPPMRDQGQLGSCTAFAVGGAINIVQAKEGIPVAEGSHLQVYYDERTDDGTTPYDAGSSIRESFSTTHKRGMAKATLWPYVISNFTHQPTPNVYTDAALTKIDQYLSVAQDLNTMKSCLADGFPFVVGFTVYASFEAPNGGVIPMPGAFEQVLGGHAVVCVGYDDATGRFLNRNSWGTGWGMGGYFTVPYLYWASPRLASDFWSPRLVSGVVPVPPAPPTPPPAPPVGKTLVAANTILRFSDGTTVNRAVYP